MPFKGKGSFAVVAFPAAAFSVVRSGEVSHLPLEPHFNDVRPPVGVDSFIGKPRRTRKSLPYTVGESKNLCFSKGLILDFSKGFSVQSGDESKGRSITTE